jgi:environmental stress-induced protein Ves
VLLINTREVAAMPWKNGGGVTRTIAVSPEGAGLEDFAWRVSIADVAESGPFSAFPGVDRTILLLDGEGMLLHGDEGPTFALTTPFQPHSMAGDEPVRAELVNGSTRDFNIMVRRGRARASVNVWFAVDSVTHAGPALFYCPRGLFKTGPASLQAGWACFVADGQIDWRVVPLNPEAVLIGVLLELQKN